MNNQNFEDAELPASGERTKSNKLRDAAGEAFSKASDTARDAGEKAKRAAADAASSMSDQVMGLLNDQLGVGAQSANRFAGSMRVAADDLEHENPCSPVLSGDLHITWTITQIAWRIKRSNSWPKVPPISRDGSRL
jgi:hypothetical protein